MKELSLNLLDVTLNSVRAEAQNILVELEETRNLLSFRIADDGCGMDEELLSSVCSPFTTTRTTRKVGLGLPLLQMAAEATGGTLTLSSKDRKNHPEDHGTELIAVFHTDHIDCPPLGDFVGTVVLLLQRAPPASSSRTGKTAEPGLWTPMTCTPGWEKIFLCLIRRCFPSLPTT